MTSKFSRWYAAARRYFSGPKTIRRSRFALMHRLELESRCVPATFTGGVTVASGDINMDGFQDIMTGAGPGGSPLVKVYSGATGQILRQFNAFDASFTGGVYVAMGDVNGDGRADMIMGAGQGGTPRVKVINGFTGGVMFDFLAFSKHFKGGVRVAAGDVNGDGRAEIICAAGPGGTPQVAVFSGIDAKLIASLTAFDTGFRGGVYVATGDLTGDNKADIIVGAGEGGSPLVSVFNLNSGSQGSSIRTFFAYNPGFTGGVRVGTGDISSADFDDIITAPGAGGGPHVKVFNGTTNAVEKEMFAYGANFRGGVFVASHSNFNSIGSQEILTGAGAGGGPHVIAFDGDNLNRLASFFAYDPNTSPGAFASLNTDKTAPVVTITSPTAPVPTQKTNVTITGRVADNLTGVTKLTASVDGGTGTTVTFDAASGAFSFATTFRVTGADDKAHTISFTATDRAKNSSTPVSVMFALDSFVTAPVLTLADASDTGTKGDLITSNATVTINGKTEANAAVTLVQSGAKTTADGTGTFKFDNVALVAGANAFTFQATDAIGNTNTGAITIRRNTGPTVSTAIADMSVSKGAADTVINLSKNFADVDVGSSLVTLNTSEGAIVIQLFDQDAPLTVANFLQYVDSMRYDNSIFHRLGAGNFALQGGGFTLDDARTFPAIPLFAALTSNELGRSNVRGTLAFAKPDRGDGSVTVTDQFFFNLVDNAFLDGPGPNNQNSGGFTVFAKVTDATLPILDRFAANYQRTDQSKTVPALPFSELPLRDYTGTNFPSDTRNSNYALLNNAVVTQRSDRLTFSAISDNTGLVTATVVGNQLTLRYTTGQTGTANITVTSMDLDGQMVTQTFHVTVT